MNIYILAVGNKMPNWVETAVSDYAKRFGRDIKLSIKEIKPEKRNNTSATQCMAEEEKRIRTALPEKPYLVILDEHGANVTSLKLSQYIDFWKQNYEGLQFCPGYTEYIEHFGKILTGEKLTSWEDLSVRNWGLDDQQNELFSVQLNQEQIAN